MNVCYPGSAMIPVLSGAFPGKGEEVPLEMGLIRIPGVTAVSDASRCDRLMPWPAKSSVSNRKCAPPEWDVDSLVDGEGGFATPPFWFKNAIIIGLH